MKLKGRDLSTLCKPKPMVIPVDNDDDIVIYYRPVLNFSEYDEKFPPPKPPTGVKPDGTQEVLYNDKAYLEADSKWAANKTEWMILKSLEADENLEWETVDPNDPDTFENVRKELKESIGEGATFNLVNKILEASNLRSDMIDLATKDFLATGAVAKD